MNRDLVSGYAEDMGTALDAMAIDRFELLENRLLRWNEHVNLTAITDPDEIAVKHFADSLSVFRAADFPKNSSVVDVGCGAGFPGLPMLIARPDLDVTFLDSVGKKLGFIKDVLKQSGLVGQTLHARAEDVAHENEYREQFDFAVSRAVAPLNILAEYAMPLIKAGGTFIAMKGAEDEAELGENAVNVLGGKIEQVVYLKLSNGDTRNLVVVKKLSQTPSKYPRRTKKITSKPL